jgi:hypothetical protein
MNILGVASLREGFFSRRSNLTTIATSMRFRIASYLASDSYRMTTALLELVNGSLLKELYKCLLRRFDKAQRDNLNGKTLKKQNNFKITIFIQTLSL